MSYIRILQIFLGRWRLRVPVIMGLSSLWNAAELAKLKGTIRIFRLILMIE